MTWRSGPVTEPSTLSTMPLLRSFLKCLKPSLPLWKRQEKEREKDEECENTKKSIGFHYLVGHVHWPVNDPATVPAQGWDEPPVNRHWQEENMLTATRNKSETQICTSKRSSEGVVWGAHQRRGARLGLKRGAQYSGLWPGFLPHCLNASLPFTPFLSSHQLFTSGYTKGNPGALIVAKRNSSPSLGRYKLASSLFRSFSF